MRAFESVMAFGLSAALPSQGLPMVVTGSPLSPGVVALEPEDLASIFGGQQQQTGKMTTIENVQEYLDGMFVAAAVNEGAMGAGALAVGAVAVGSAGAVLGAYGITQQIFNDLVDPLAGDIYNVISYQGQSGRLATTDWSLSDIVYRSDLVISLEATGWISDWECGDIGCFCDGGGCNGTYVCLDGYCAYNS